MKGILISGQTLGREVSDHRIVCGKSQKEGGGGGAGQRGGCTAASALPGQPCGRGETLQHLSPGGGGSSGFVPLSTRHRALPAAPRAFLPVVDRLGLGLSWSAGVPGPQTDGDRLWGVTAGKPGVSERVALSRTEMNLFSWNVCSTVVPLSCVHRKEKAREMTAPQADRGYFLNQLARGSSLRRVEASPWASLLPVPICFSLSPSQAWVPLEPLHPPRDALSFPGLEPEAAPEQGNRSLVGSLIIHLSAPRAPLQNPHVPPGVRFSLSGRRPETGQGAIGMGNLDGSVCFPVRDTLAWPGLLLA